MSTQRNLEAGFELRAPTLPSGTQCLTCTREMSDRWARTHQRCAFCVEVSE